MGSWGEWSGIAGPLVALTIWAVYAIKIRPLRIPVLRVLHERGIMDLAGIIRALKETELYPPRTPMFFIKSACRSGIKAGLIIYGGDAVIAIIPRFKISNKGLEFLDQCDWRKGKKKFPAQ